MKALYTILKFLPLWAAGLALLSLELAWVFKLRGRIGLAILFVFLFLVFAGIGIAHFWLRWDKQFSVFWLEAQ